MADNLPGNELPICHDLLSELSIYIDGEAAEDVCAAIERHLADCPDCRALVDTTRKTVQLAHDLPQPAFPEEARPRLLRALQLDSLV